MQLLSSVDMYVEYKKRDLRYSISVHFSEESVSIVHVSFVY